MSEDRLPLEGYTVLDLTQARAGPTAARVLADWGANVIYIEPPATSGKNRVALTGKRDALGAQVVVSAGGQKLLRPIISSGSFQSAIDPVAHFGLGRTKQVDGVEVLWPDGKVERFGPTPVDREITLRQGEGRQGG